MPTFEHTIEIAAPIDHVFEFWSDPNNWERTMPSLSNVESIEETDDGRRFTFRWKMLGISMDGEMEYEVVEPNEHTVTGFETPGMAGEVHVRYSETDDGTEVVQQADYEFGDSLPDRILAPVGKRYNERQFRNSLRTSKELIEAETEALIEA